MVSLCFFLLLYQLDYCFTNWTINGASLPYVGSGTLALVGTGCRSITLVCLLVFDMESAPVDTVDFCLVSAVRKV